MDTEDGVFVVTGMDSVTDYILEELCEILNKKFPGGDKEYKEEDVKAFMLPAIEEIKRNINASDEFFKNSMYAWTISDFDGQKWLCIPFINLTRMKEILKENLNK